MKTEQTTIESQLTTPLAKELFMALQEVRADIAGEKKLPRRPVLHPLAGIKW